MARGLLLFRRSRRLTWGVSALLAGVVLSLGAASRASAAGVPPNATNNLDCNGWSASYHSAKGNMGSLCTDPIQVKGGQASRFIDNGWYVGHDEPSVKFISDQPGSGNQMTYLMRLPRDPSRQPTASGSVTDYGELSPAPWMGLPICDPNSYPQNPCTLDSDTNQSQINNPAAAGSAFLELQLYPPGFTPFVDSISCSKNKWCAALTIDSLECTFGFATCNTNCIEPVNFAYLTNDGVPTGPPSPQLTDVSTFTPNGHTLFMNGGDVLEISLSDPPQGLTAAIRDLTTHRTGYVVASAANGFMDTNIADCTGTPFTFHAEYNTARQQNQVPWAALEGGVLMEQEIGHFEACNSVTNQLPFSRTYPGGQSFTDPNVYETCVGGSEGATSTGEGPCSPMTAVCIGSTTQTGAPCPTNNAASGALCEFSDGYCFPAGDRPLLINGSPAEASWPLAGCTQSRFENGDLDFDGTDYQPGTWPDGSPNHPTAASYLGPFTGGSPYPTIQFETDVGGSEILCKPATGAGCTAPPLGANFYPFWTLGAVGGPHALRASHGLCVWNFGNVLATTSQTFGRTAEYGTPDVARYGGTLTSAPIPNPQLSTRCGGGRKS